jgi:hypothetical protein
VRCVPFVADHLGSLQTFRHIATLVFTYAGFLRLPAGRSHQPLGWTAGPQMHELWHTFVHLFNVLIRLCRFKTDYTAAVIMTTGVDPAAIQSLRRKRAILLNLGLAATATLSRQTRRATGNRRVGGHLYLASSSGALWCSHAGARRRGMAGLLTWRQTGVMAHKVRADEHGHIRETDGDRVQLQRHPK